ncbi:hypothetical protein NP493_245g01040 [Ridgeia piscesae]|uniref:Uncharacterized protein n=1 Tax=Ridgeia piscesae TaxID=27915 RepID=A0AAD9NZ56_RIDPI|nr:hypothetical protein NP493_245g01040 [Ridgeia piscesae]
MFKKVFILKYLLKVFDIFKYFKINVQIHCQYQHFCFMITCNACQTDYLQCKSPFTKQC